VNLGLVQIRRFSGNSTDDERALTVQGSQRGARTALSGAAEAGVAEHFQPMWVRSPGQLCAKVGLNGDGYEVNVEDVWRTRVCW
jgi:hypothetical protein